MMIQVGGHKVLKQVNIIKEREIMVEIIHLINHITNNLRILKAINKKILDSYIKINPISAII